LQNKFAEIFKRVLGDCLASSDQIFPSAEDRSHRQLKVESWEAVETDDIKSVQSDTSLKRGVNKTDSVEAIRAIGLAFHPTFRVLTFQRF
jgi:hypothetical protein